MLNGFSAESAVEYLCARLLVTQFFHRACSARSFHNDPGPYSPGYYLNAPSAPVEESS